MKIGNYYYPDVNKRTLEQLMLRSIKQLRDYYYSERKRYSQSKGVPDYDDYGPEYRSVEEQNYYEDWDRYLKFVNKILHIRKQYNDDVKIVGKTLIPLHPEYNLPRIVK